MLAVSLGALVLLVLAQPAPAITIHPAVLKNFVGKDARREEEGRGKRGGEEEIKGGRVGGRKKGGERRGKGGRERNRERERGGGRREREGVIKRGVEKEGVKE